MGRGCFRHCQVNMMTIASCNCAQWLLGAARSAAAQQILDSPFSRAFPSKGQASRPTHMRHNNASRCAEALTVLTPSEGTVLWVTRSINCWRLGSEMLRRESAKQYRIAHAVSTVAFAALSIRLSGWSVRFQQFVFLHALKGFHHIRAQA